MRRRRRVLGRSRPPGAGGLADGAVVVAAFVTVVAAVSVRSSAVDPPDWPVGSDVSVMHNVSEMIERLLDNYDVRLRPQFGGRHSTDNITSASTRSISRLLTPKTRPSLGLSPQNGRRPLRDVAEPPCTILRRSVKHRPRNPLPYIKKRQRHSKLSIIIIIIIVNLIRRPLQVLSGAVQT